MAGLLEEFGNLKIEQIKVDGWSDGTYNTHITYCGKIFAIKYHFHAGHQREIDMTATLYDLTNGLDIIGRCNLYKDLLDDVLKLEVKMEMKIQNGLKYNFDIDFVHSCLREIVKVVHEDIQDIYFNLKFEAVSKGGNFFIPLPDYTFQNEAEKYTEKEQSTDIAIKGNPENETLEIIKKDVKLIIELVKIQHENERTKAIDIMIKEGILLPEPSLETGKYTTSNSTPDTIAWIKLNDMQEKFPPKLFFAMIETNCKLEIIKKYYRDL